MYDSYFDYLIDDLSFFSRERLLMSLRRSFRGYPFDESSKKIISEVTEKKYLAEQWKIKLKNLEKDLEKIPTDFKTGPMTQSVVESTGSVCLIVFILTFLITSSFLFNIVTGIYFNSAIKFILFIINILSGTASGIYILAFFIKSPKIKNKFYFTAVIALTLISFITIIWSALAVNIENSDLYLPQIYFTLLPFLIFLFSSISSAITFCLIKVILYGLKNIEKKLYTQKIEKEIELTGEAIEEVNEEIEEKQSKLLTDENIELIRELSLKYKHIFFPFKLSDKEIVQANQAIAIGESLKGLEMIKKHMGDDIEKYPAYHFWQGVKLTEEEDFEKAYNHLNRCIKMLSPIKDIVLALCFLNIKNNNPDFVEEAIKQEPLLSSDSGEKFFLRGLAQYIDKKFDQAALTLQKAHSIKPGDDSLTFFLLTVLLKLKDYEKMRLILKNFSGQKNIKEMFLGLIEYNQKNYKKAIEYFDIILKKAGTHTEALCFRELAKGQIKRHPLFKRKNMAQKLISLLPDDMEKEEIKAYSIAKLYQLEGKNREALSYYEEAYRLDPEHPEITAELGKFYFKTPYDDPLRIEVMLKAIPIMGGKKRFLRKLFTHLLEETEVPQKIFSLLEKQYFKNINYDPLMVKILAKSYLNKNVMNKKSTEVYLKALDLNSLEGEEKNLARKMIVWYDAETGSIHNKRQELYKNLLKEYPHDERIIFLNCSLLSKEKNFIEKNPQVFREILKSEYLNSKFWKIFNLEREEIIEKIVKYYYKEKIYIEENKELIEEYFDSSPRDLLALFIFGEHSKKIKRYDEKALEVYKEMHREKPEDNDILMALARAYLACNVINFDTITVLEKIFIKELAWNEAIKVLTDYYIKKKEEGKLKKDLIVLCVWGKYTELKPRDYKVRFYIAEELFDSQDYMQASEKYEEIIALVPSHRDAKYKLAECYIQMDKINEGVEILKSIVTNQNDLHTFIRLAEVYLHHYKDTKKSIEYYEKASSLDTKNMEILKLLLELYKKLRDKKNMIKIQEKITVLEPTGENLATQGHFYIKTNMLEKGITSLKKAIKKGFTPGGKVHFMLAEAKYYMLQEKDDREEWLDLIDIVSEAINLGCRDKKLYEMRYQGYLKIGNKTKAVEDRKIFAPHDLDNLYQLALENEGRKDFKSARENLIQIYRKDKNFLDVVLKLAGYYSLEKSFDKKHIDIILYAFQSKTSQFLRLDRDSQLINHLHNYYKSKNLYKEEIEFLEEILKNKHPYNEGTLKSWIAINMIETGSINEACKLLDDIDINMAKEDLLEAHLRLSEELLFKKEFKIAEEILEKIYLIDPTFKNVGALLEHFRRERIGRFALLSSIGSGANATVYKAFDLVTRNYVAVKRLHRELRSDKEAIDNFRKEYEILEEVIHPGIAKVIPESFNKNYFALELLDKSLAGVIEENKGGLDLNSFFSIATQIVEALHYMHSKNIIYHDLAPDNIMFAGEMVKFCDLGGAKRFDLKTKKTIIASTEKHYLYASPEQCKHEFDHLIKVDHRSDIYSLGVLMYQMLTGIPPFTGPDQALISAHQHSKPSPVLLQKSNLPRQLTSIISKSLEKNPDDRQQSMEEVLQGLMNTPRMSSGPE